GDFGVDYIQRNSRETSIATNMAFFSCAMQHATKIESCLEFGSNIGLNLIALNRLFPSLQLAAIEINSEAVSVLNKWIQNLGGKVHHCSILDFEPEVTVDLVLVKGGLIHIAPEQLPDVYDRLYKSSRRSIFIAEYDN
ncbi:MAG: pseudaminic acid biosynthesis-associated methylase, partial [Gammaproteobacteria bacterium]|nr:pseudaminic acid biosynthesis-associated methylase [Gammaproteobacteria bacterium]